jgi:hypothetical protein
VNSRRAINGVLGAAFAAALATAAGWARGAESEAPPETKEAGAGAEGAKKARTLPVKPRPAAGDRESEDSKGPTVPGKAKVQKKPPASVALPAAAGEYPAEEILPLAGKLMGCTVRMENQRVLDTKVEISVDMAGADVSLEELTVLLAAHKLYLFPVTDPKEGPIVVVSKDPYWRDEPPRYTTVVQVAPEEFKAAVAKLRKLAAQKNAGLPPEEEGMVVVSSERAGKIFVRSSRKEDIDEAGALVGSKPEKDPARPRLYTYQGAHRRVEELRDAVLEELKEADRERLHMVIGSRGNRLFYRCPADLGEKVRQILEKLDKPPERKQER